MDNCKCYSCLHHTRAYIHHLLVTKELLAHTLLMKYVYCFTCVICTSNSMGSSEIWDKYHECCIGNGDKFHEAKPSGIYHFQYNKSSIYPKFHCYPCYSQLIPYSLHMRMLCISVAMYAICHYVLNTCQH